MNGLRYIYTYKSCVVDNIDELITPVTNLNPHMICITETKPKHAQFNLSLPKLQIQAYKVFYNNLEDGDGIHGCACITLKAI